MGTLSYIHRYYIHYITRHCHHQLKMPKGSGLTKPLKISDDLAELLSEKKGSTLSRPEVVKRLWAYIKEKKLQDPDNKQFFKPDKKMIPIFGEDKVRAFGMASTSRDISDEHRPGI